MRTQLAALVAAVHAVQAIDSSALITRQASSNCSSLELVLVRGTDEPGGNFGYGISVGDKVFNATSALVNGVTGYGVKYPANLDCDSVPIGISDLVNRVTTVSAACKGQKFALIGYSQGADVVYRASAALPTSLYDSIIAIVGFGDPNHRGEGNTDPLGGMVLGPLPSPLSSRLKENCAFEDPVCSNNGTLLTQHTSYYHANETYINNTAAYIQKQLEQNGNAGPDLSQATPPGNETDANVSVLLYLGKLLGETSTGTLQSMCPVSSSSTAASTTGASVPANSTATMTGSSSPSRTGSTASGSTDPTATSQSSTGSASAVVPHSQMVVSAAILFGALHLLA